ncbi:MAG: RNA methyltransferase [Planctomycetota bacterium]|nr:RNA methyltransferase [Planctomycetota bacterium]
MSLTITSLQNPRVKSAIELRRRRGRDQQDRVLIDGVREIHRALQAGVEFVEIFACPEQCDELGQRLLDDCDRQSIERVKVTAAVFEKLAFGNRAEGVIAVARIRPKSLADIRLPPSALVVVLEGLEKPGNVGAVLRTADAAGVTAVVVADGGTDLYNPNLIRASLGAIFTVPVCAVTSEAVLAWLHGHGLKIFAARVDAAVDYTAVSYRGPCALVLGSEAWGLSKAWQGAAITAIRLPMLGVVDSLNVSTTAAVLCYEAVRQRRSN